MGRVITITFGIMIMIAVLVQSILLLIPFIKRIQFDETCYHYSANLMRSETIDETGKTQLIQDLEMLGFTNSNCTFRDPESDDPYIITVQSDYPMKYISSDLTTKELMLPLQFKISSLKAVEIVYR